MDYETKAFLVFALIVSSLFASVGQLFFKLGFENTIITFLIYIAIGIIFYGVSTLIYLFVLGRAHLSWVYSFGGLSYIFTSFFAIFFLSEPMSLGRWVGVILIIIGSVLISLS